MKKIHLIFIFIIFLVILLPINRSVNAKTINDLYNDINQLTEQKNIYTNLNNDDISALQSSSTDILKNIDNYNNEINKINSIITEKEKKIEEINSQINSYLVFNQVANGQSFYFEYILDAEDYTEMIYRQMLIYQLTIYSNNLINELQDEITNLENKKNDISLKIQKLNTIRNNYRNIEILLKKYHVSTVEGINDTLDEEINSVKRSIEMYEKLGCSKNIDLTYCINIPNSQKFNYPLFKGCVSSFYSSSHLGIDLACNQEGTEVYSAAPGIIADIKQKSSCGGNVVYIYHKINGNYYTSIYGHLLDIKVNIGDIVTENSIIGSVGGDSTSITKGGYDKCTTGAHLHFVTVEGFHTNDFTSFTINPNYFNQYPGLLNGYFIRNNQGFSGIN